MTDRNALSLVESIEKYIEARAFPVIDRIEVFFSSSSAADPLIGGQIVEVQDRRGAKHELEFGGMFKRLIEYKLTAEKRGAGWNIVCAPGVPNAKFSGRAEL